MLKSILFYSPSPPICFCLPLFKVVWTCFRRLSFIACALAGFCSLLRDSKLLFHFELYAHPMQLQLPSQNLKRPFCWTWQYLCPFNCIRFLTEWSFAALLCASKKCNYLGGIAFSFICHNCWFYSSMSVSNLIKKMT